ncbi:hypothetical protein Gohar_013675 [Gossypium harknessii]|uniref:Uncharacterized protein n=1 Tax=Gossypium harknessii TaxID=34285 RepID=A0A7J9H0U7_9ROSI|nr:hypothetical protein [Gossypium harknessii]
MNYKEIWALVCYHQWEQFCVTSTNNANISVVQEFYASLKDKLIKRGYNAVTTAVKGKGSWNYRPDTELPTNFNQAIMFPIAKMWMQFIGTRIAHALDVSNVKVFRVVLLYGILQQKNLCRALDLSRDETVHAKPKSWTFHPPSRNSSMSPSRGANEPNLTHHDEGVNLEEESTAQEYLGMEDKCKVTF